MNTVDEAVHDLCEMPEDQWEGYLDEYCAGDEVLRVEIVMAMREADAKQPRLLPERGGAMNLATGDGPMVGPRVGETAEMGFEEGHMLSRIRERVLGVESAAVPLGRFIVLERLGQGGMGTVFSAYDPQLDRKVALKLLREDVGGSTARARERLLREAQALAQLTHPNVIPVYELVLIDERVVVVMAFIKGQTLGEWVESEPRTWREVLDLYIEAARGLAAAHDVGIIHRDFKPANVLVRDDGRVFVADFGLSCAGERFSSQGDVEELAEISDRRSSPGLAVPLTHTGAFMGTPAYMAPEQFSGGEVDEQADQFGFCVSLYESLCGQRPFAGEDIAELAAATEAGAIQRAPSDRQIPGWLLDVVTCGLSPDPHDRWPSMRALIAALGDDPADRWRRRRRVAVLAALVVAVVAILGWVAQSARTQSQAERAGKRAAQAERDRAHRDLELANRDLENELRRTRDASRMLALQSLDDDPTQALAVLREVEEPDQVLRWHEKASVLLRRPVAGVVLEGHEDVINAVAFSPDGRLLATASQDSTARIWTVDAWHEPRVLAGHVGELRDIEFSPDGTQVVTASADGTARVWSVTDEGAPPTILSGHEARIRAATFSPDGDAIATASDDGTARVWRADGQGESISLRGHTGAVYALAFSPDGTRIATGSADGTARVWQADGRGEPALFAGHGAALNGIEFDADGGRVLTSSLDKTARVWDVSGAAPTIVLPHEEFVRLARFSPDGARIVTACYDNTARIWDAATGAQVDVLEGHEGAVVRALFSPDGTQIATSSLDGTARLWSASGERRSRVLRGHRGAILAMEFSPDGEHVATGSWDDTARIWSTESGSATLAISAHDSDIFSVDISADGTRLLSAAADNTARIWEKNARRHVPIVLRGHEGHVTDARFSPDQTLVATACKDRTARLWSARDGARIAILRGHTNSLRTIAFSPDGALVVTASADHTARIWKTDGSGEPVAVLAGHGNELVDAEFSPDGTRVLSVSTDGTARVWSVDDGRELAVLAGHASGLNDGEFSPDGTRIATAATDGTARVWRVDGRGNARIFEHPGNIYCARFSPGGSRLLTCGLDGIARIWDVEDSTPSSPIELRGHQDAILDASFSPDGTLVLTTSYDTTARVWRADGVGYPIVLSGHEKTVSSGSFTPDGNQVVTGSYDGTLRVWNQLRPMDGFADALWRATTYCPPVATRRELLGASDDAAAAQDARCQRQVCRISTIREDVHSGVSWCPDRDPGGVARH